MDGERENFPPPAPWWPTSLPLPVSWSEPATGLGSPTARPAWSLLTSWPASVRLAEGTCSGERLTISGGKEGESGWITPAMTRPQLDQMLEGKQVLAVIRVLD